VKCPQACNCSAEWAMLFDATAHHLSSSVYAVQSRSNKLVLVLHTLAWGRMLTRGVLIQRRNACLLLDEAHLQRTALRQDARKNTSSDHCTS
jgi:hypothetical protein